MSIRKNWYPVLLGLVLGTLLAAGSQLAILPTRRRAFEPDFDLNRLLFDPGKCRERQLRKLSRRLRLADLQAKAVRKIGGRHGLA